MTQSADQRKSRSLTALRAVNTKWDILSQRAVTVLKRVILLTIGKGHEAIAFSTRDLAAGNAGWSGLEVSASTVSRALRELQLHGLIQREREDGRYAPTTVTIKPKRLHAGPKKQAKRQTAKSVVAKAATRTVVESAPTYTFRGSKTRAVEGDTKESQNLLSSKEASSRVTNVTIAAERCWQFEVAEIRIAEEDNDMPTVEEVLANIGKQNDARAARNRARLAALPPRQDYGEAAWLAAMNAAYGVRPVPWSKLQRGQAKHLHGRWLNDTPAVLEYLVANWKSVMTMHFSWMTQKPPPSAPDLGFILSQSDVLFRAWEKRITIRAGRSPTDDLEARAAALAAQKGITLLEAAFELGQAAPKAAVKAQSPFEQLMGRANGR